MNTGDYEGKAVNPELVHRTKWFQVLRLRYQTEGLFFYADRPPRERRPWQGLYIKWGCGYRVPRPHSTAADGVTVRYGQAHAENWPGG